MGEKSFVGLLPSFKDFKAQTESMFYIETFPGLTIQHIHKFNSIFQLSNNIKIGSFKVSIGRDVYGGSYPIFQSNKIFVPNLAINILNRAQINAIYTKDNLLLNGAVALSPFFITQGRFITDGSNFQGMLELNLQQPYSNITASGVYDKEKWVRFQEATAIFGNTRFAFGGKVTSTEDQKYLYEALIHAQLTKSIIHLSLNYCDKWIANLSIVKQSDPAIRFGLDTSVSSKKEFSLNLSSHVQLKKTAVHSVVSSKLAITTIFSRQITPNIGFDVSVTVQHLTHDYDLGFSFTLDTSKK
ncbi:hypothetical protein GPJ56_001820 [Histomonas meleagridis]|uniref:uncharacterized protein n=1 Tax=Histomonas meleagridis TaxID=135588 RepID=UPI0035594006|nr:hypothetical protein GPJ56_001820 [Histomonas meleagridis]KAH0803243.1 hypothetical protein GO595_003979 [Histomonas meleagridis]